MIAFKELAILSVTAPAKAARQVIALNLPRDVLWMGFALVVVLNTLIYGITDLVTPGPTPFPPILSEPPVYLALVSCALFLIVATLTWGGRILGGTGTFQTMLVVIVWLQALRVLVQAGVLVLLLAFPPLAAILVFVAGIAGLWILAHFVAQAHGFESLGRAAAAIIFAFVGMVFGTSLFLSFIGFSF